MWHNWPPDQPSVELIMSYIRLITALFIGLLIGHISPTPRVKTNNHSGEPTESTTTRTDRQKDHPEENFYTLTNRQIQQITDELKNHIDRLIESKYSPDKIIENDSPSDIKMAHSQNVEKDLINRIESGAFFASGNTINDLEKSDEMNSLSPEQQGRILRKVFGKLNMGEISKEQVFGRPQQ